MDTESFGVPSPQNLKWVHTLWGPEPLWVKDPDEGAIAQTTKTALNLTDACSVRFLAQGAFNKLYTITSGGKEFVIRVSLPILPLWKTESEVATMEWVRRKTSLPVPHVYAHMSSQSNSVGFEWIIMQKAPGKALADVWRGLDFSAKEEIVRRLATFASSMFEHQMRGIGSLFYSKSPALRYLGTAAIEVSPGGSSSSDSISLGPSTSSIFVSPWSPPTPQGPFSSTRQWIFARLDFAAADLQHRLGIARRSSLNGSTYHHSEDGSGVPQSEDDDDAEDPEDLENAMSILERLRPLVDSFFPPRNGTESETSMIFHDDLNKQNILVDENGSITAVLDWESISTVPLFIGCQYPPFLEGRPSETKPNMTDDYRPDENGEPPELYWEHLEMYELTQLRKLFLAAMRRLQPRWVEIFESSQRQRDFDLAMASADDLFMGRRLRNWLSDVESGKTGFMGLEERIDNDIM